jgi:hypothetical protein
MGRSGVHAYCSKDTCIRMAKIVAGNLEAVTSGDPGRKLPVLRALREKLN